MEQEEAKEIERFLESLALDEEANAQRLELCATLALAMGTIGQDVSALGRMIGPDRRSGASPFRFGDDRAVGVGLVAQIASELARGATDLIVAGNLYASGALVRQLVEVEYLAHAFAADDAIAAQWLRADRKERRTFWTPAKLRERSAGMFLPSDYWHHCDMGGHPTVDGRSLLAGHGRLSPAFLAVDLVGHVTRIWDGLLAAVDPVFGGALPEGWNVSSLTDLITEWRAADRLHRAFGGLVTYLRADPLSDLDDQS